MSSIALSGIAGLVSLALVTSSTSVAVKPHLQRVAAMQMPRSVHTATTLPSGEVLLTGGMADGGGSLAAAEIFDPARNTVREIAALSERRASHTATLLPDGRVLIAGGYNGEYLASLEIYDPATRRFRAGGSLGEGRSGHTATQLRDGRILFAGGVGRGWTFLRSAELYDPATGRSEPVGSLGVPRESHTATLLADGRVLVVGGHNGRRQNMEVFASTEIFDPRTRRFEPAGDLVTPRHKHDALRLADGRVLVIGGADRSDRVHFASTEIWDPATRTFSAGPTMTHQRYKIAGTSVLLPDGNVLVTSGGPAAEVLSVARGSTHEVAGRYPDAYRFAAVASLADGSVLISGGYGAGIRSTDGVWRFRQP